MIFISFMLFLYCGIQKHMQYLRCGCTKHAAVPPLTQVVVPGVPQGTANPFGCQGTLLIHAQVVINQNSQSVSMAMLSNLLPPSLQIYPVIPSPLLNLAIAPVKRNAIGDLTTFQFTRISLQTLSILERVNSSSQFRVVCYLS